MSERSVRTERSGGPPIPGEPLNSSDPRKIGRYEVLSRLGSGGMGAVYLARDDRGRRVAVKVIRGELANDEEFRARFGDEVAAARRVAPFCTAEVLDADPNARQPYLVTEFIDGKRLDTVVEESGPLSHSTLQGVAVGVASALTAIHGAGIVHRDLKPSNVMLSYSGPRVIDFGIARALDAVAGRTRSGIVLGSLGWMAPEQMEGAPVGPATDIFAWGLLVGYAATGIHPYGEGSFYEISERVLSGTPDLSGISDDLRPIVARTLGRDPRLRPSAEQILMTLLGESGRGNVRVAATRVLDGTWPGTRSSAAAAGAAGIAGAAAADAVRRPSADRGGSRQPAAGGGYQGAGGYGDRYRGQQPPPAAPRQAAAHGYSPPPAPAAPYAPPQQPAGPPARREPDPRQRRGNEYVKFEPSPAPVPAPQPPAARRAPAPYAPPQPPAPQPQRQAAPRPAQPAAPPSPAPAPRPERVVVRRHGRVRWFGWIPKRLVIFAVIAIILYFVGDELASAANHKREELWKRAVHAVENQIDEWRGQAVEQGNEIGRGVGDQVKDGIGDAIKDKSGISAPPSLPAP